MGDRVTAGIEEDGQQGCIFSANKEMTLWEMKASQVTQTVQLRLWLSAEVHVATAQLHSGRDNVDPVL